MFKEKKRKSDTVHSILPLIIPSTQAAVLSFLGDTILAALSPVKIQKLQSLSLWGPSGCVLALWEEPEVEKSLQINLDQASCQWTDCRVRICMNPSVPHTNACAEYLFLTASSDSAHTQKLLQSNIHVTCLIYKGIITRYSITVWCSHLMPLKYVIKYMFPNMTAFQ